MAREGKQFLSGEKDVGRAVVNRVHNISLAESLPGKETFLLLSGSAIVISLGTPPYGILTI